LSPGFEHNVSARLTSRISDWAPNLRRTITDAKPKMTAGRVHFMPIQFAACGC
jgi:hypothetical protein